MWAATWQNQLSECAPSEDSDQPGFLATHWAHSEDSDQTGRIPRLIWVFAGRTLSLLVLSCSGSCHLCMKTGGFVVSASVENCQAVILERKFINVSQSVNNRTASFNAYWGTLYIWAASWQNQQSGMCAQRRLRLGIRPFWSVSSLSAWRNHGSLATKRAHSEDSDQTGRMPRLIWGITGRTLHFVGFVTRRLIF